MLRSHLCIGQRAVRWIIIRLVLVVQPVLEDLVAVSRCIRPSAKRTLVGANPRQQRTGQPFLLKAAIVGNDVISASSL